MSAGNATIIKVHRHSQGASQRVMTTKIQALTDALDNLVRFQLLPGHRFNTLGVEPLIEGIHFGGLIADKAFVSDWIVKNLNERGAKIVISQHPRRSKPLDVDAEIYKWRHLIGILLETQRVQAHRDAQ